MKIQETKTVELTINEIKLAIHKHMEKLGYKIKGDIEFDIKKEQWTEGFGVGEIDYEKIVLQGAKCELEKI